MVIGADFGELGEAWQIAGRRNGDERLVERGGQLLKEATGLAKDLEIALERVWRRDSSSALWFVHGELPQAGAADL